MKKYYVYIVKCNDGTYYTGVTNDLDRRIGEHTEGNDSKNYTFKRRPISLQWFAEFSDIKQAIEKEKQIKRWSKKKKEAIINEDYESLIEYSKKRFE